MATGQVRRIDTQYFTSAIRELDSAITNFNTSLRKIDKQTKQLQATWDGKGADKFDSAYKRLKREFDDQSATLSAIRDDLQVILESYQDWDNQAKSDIAGGG